ncbi:hypothetical protein PVK06_029766 [Gossypium arboreum]|uniref:Uncharacterized protein n=1 Tax=Gossypium arboreum TaxID=29729 RepID=A0ABR0NLG4_GOSAR|nr:hypothetical protein PVK06_029766 [Gossypium arboreum]
MVVNGLMEELISLKDKLLSWISNEREKEECDGDDDDDEEENDNDFEIIWSYEKSLPQNLGELMTTMWRKSEKKPAAVELDRWEEAKAFRS